MVMLKIFAVNISHWPILVTKTSTRSRNFFEKRHFPLPFKSYSSSHDRIQLQVFHPNFFHAIVQIKADMIYRMSSKSLNKEKFEYPHQISTE